jgi:hypothetical protein
MLIKRVDGKALRITLYYIGDIAAEEKGVRVDLLPSVGRMLYRAN